MSRYLIVPFIQSALNRGTSAAQLLGRFTADGEQALRWIELRPGEEGGVEVWVHEVFEDGGEGFAGIVELASVDEDAEDEPAANVHTLAEALALARERYGAAPDRWVHESMLDDEYLDFVRASQPAAAPDPPAPAAEDAGREAPAPEAEQGGLADFLRALGRFRFPG